MAEHEFERFLEVLSKLLKLSSKETGAVADEICDHLEERYSELVGMGVSRDDAVKQALDEFDDAGEFAGRLNQLVRQRTRRRMMTGALTTAAASALAILATTAFWPDQRPGQGSATNLIAQDAEKKSESGQAESEIIYIDRSRYLPESLRKSFDIDLNDVELRAFAKSVQELTGYPVILDMAELTNAGIGPDAVLNLKTFHAPIYLVMDRAFENVAGTEMAWDLDDEIIYFTTREKADTLVRAQTVDVSELLDDGYAMSDIINVLQHHSSGPWMDIDGDGGTMIPLGTRLTFAQTQHGRFEVLSLLEGMRTLGRRIAIDQPELNRKIHSGLAASVTCDFHDKELTEVLEDLGHQIEIPIVLDRTELVNSGLSGGEKISLSLPANPLQRVFKILLADVDGTELAAIPEDGVLKITTREKVETIWNVEIFDVSDLVSQDEMWQVVNLIEAGTSEPWVNIDGEGGSATPIPGQRVVVRQTRSGLQAVNRLLNDHRNTVRMRPPRPEPDANQVEVRYYRMTDRLAGELQVIIPRFVAVESWANLPDGALPLIEKISVGDQAPYDLQRNAGGFGGGGFFQMGGAMPPSEMAGTESLVNKFLEELNKREATKPSPTAVLAIRQTLRVHKEIDNFLRELAEKAWPDGYGSYIRGPHPQFFGASGLGGLGGP